MKDLEAFILQHEGSQKDIMQYLHSIMASLPGVTGKISYKLPFYYRKSWLCYLSPTKEGKVEFAFTRGNELSNIQGILESKGRKQVFSVTFSKLEEINKPEILEIIQEALLLDESIAYAPKRKKKKQ